MVGSRVSNIGVLARVMTVLLVLLLLAAVWGGHEVVYQYKLKASDLRPEELAIIQYDSRGLSPSSSSAPTQDLQYWQAAALINNAYAKHHGHSYFYITRDPVAIQSGERCSYGSFLLHDVWCKVLAMNRAEALVKSYSSKHGSKGGGIKAYVYLDSDAIVSTNYSLTDVIGYMRQELSWDLHQVHALYTMQRSLMATLAAPCGVQPGRAGLGVQIHHEVGACVVTVYVTLTYLPTYP